MPVFLRSDAAPAGDRQHQQNGYREHARRHPGNIAQIDITL
jgi:hypothetical protein